MGASSGEVRAALAVAVFRSRSGPAGGAAFADFHSHPHSRERLLDALNNIDRRHYPLTIPTSLEAGAGFQARAGYYLMLAFVEMQMVRRGHL